MRYQCLKKNTYRNGDYCLKSIRYQDILSIKKWRNEQIRVIRQQNILSDKEQLDYYYNVIVPSFTKQNPPMVLLSYLLRDICIGYGGLVHIDWNNKRAEASFLLDTQRIKSPIQYKKEFSIFLEMIKIISFEEFTLNRIFTETFDLRPWHVHILEENGFKLEGRLKQHVFIDGVYRDSLVHGYLKIYYDA